MNCPHCNGKTRVIDTTTTERASIRRRKCLVCDYLFYTEETIKDNSDKLRHKFYEIKSGKYEKKPVSSEELKLRLIKRMMGSTK